MVEIMVAGHSPRILFHSSSRRTHNADFRQSAVCVRQTHLRLRPYCIAMVYIKGYPHEIKSLFDHFINDMADIYCRNLNGLLERTLTYYKFSDFSR